MIDQTTRTITTIVWFILIISNSKLSFGEIQQTRINNNNYLSFISRDLTYADSCGKDYTNLPLYVENRVGEFGIKLELIRQAYDQTTQTMTLPRIQLQGYTKYDDNRSVGFDCGLYGVNSTLRVVTHFFQIYLIPEEVWQSYVVTNDTAGFNFWNMKYISGLGFNGPDSYKVQPIDGGLSYIIPSVLSAEILPEIYGIKTMKEFVRHSQYRVLVVGKSVILYGYAPPTSSGSQSSSSLVGPWFTVGEDKDSIPCSDSMFSEPGSSLKIENGITTCDHLRTFVISPHSFFSREDFLHIRDTVENTNLPTPNPPHSVNPQPQPNPEIPISPEPLSPPQIEPQSPQPKTLTLSDFYLQRFPPFLTQPITILGFELQCLVQIFYNSCVLYRDSSFIFQYLLAKEYDQITDENCQCECIWNIYKEVEMFLKNESFFTQSGMNIRQNKCLGDVKLPYISYVPEIASEGPTELITYDSCLCTSVGEIRTTPTKILTSEFNKIPEELTLSNQQELTRTKNLTIENNICSQFEFYPLFEFAEGEKCELEKNYHNHSWDGDYYMFNGCIRKIRPYVCQCSCLLDPQKSTKDNKNTGWLFTLVFGCIFGIILIMMAVEAFRGKGTLRKYFVRDRKNIPDTTEMYRISEEERKRVRKEETQFSQTLNIPTNKINYGIYSESDESDDETYVTL